MDNLEKSDLYDLSKDARDLGGLFLTLAGPPVTVRYGIDGLVRPAIRLETLGWCEEVKRIEKKMEEAQPVRSAGTHITLITWM